MRWFFAAFAAVFLSGLSGGILGGAAQAAERVALLVGNAFYENESRLRTPLNDLAEMRRVLESQGFEVDALENVDESTLSRVLGGFSRKAALADTAVFYFSGHGMEIGGRNYLVPVNAYLESPGDARFEAIALDQAISAASGASRLSLVIVDASRDNRFPNALNGGAKGFKAEVAKEGQVISFSAAAGAVAPEGSGSLSPYTQALTEALTEGAGGDVRALFNALGERATAIAGAPQSPYNSFGRLPNAVVTFSGEAPAAGSSAVAPSAGGDDPRETLLFQQAIDLESVELMEHFLTAYPASPLRPAAEAWLVRWGGAGDGRWRPSASDYRTAQQELQRLGLYSGDIDGDWGAGSSNALAEFQQRMNIDPADGVLTQASLDMLEIAPSTQRVDAAKTPDLGVFSECDICPDMVVVPAGGYRIGSPDSEPQREADESPQIEVTLQRFAIGRTEITFDQWDACVDDGGCDGYRPSDEGWGRGDMPAIFLSWHNAQKYIEWLNGKLGTNAYRLPSESEWEYAARAGTTTIFSHGDQITSEQVNFDGSVSYNGSPKSVNRGRTVRTGSLPPNPWGLYEVHGNVREWVQDCWRDSYAGLPTDGGAWAVGDCSRSSRRSGSWQSNPRYVRAANREASDRGTQGANIGFRIARTLE